MAARATRSASRKARVTEAVATGPFGALSHDALGVIVDGLADPLQPVVAVAFSSTCKGLRTPLQAALEVLRQRFEKAKALCLKVRKTRGCSKFGEPGPSMVETDPELAGKDFAVLLDHKDHACRLEEIEELWWSGLGLTDADIAALGMIMRYSQLPKLSNLGLMENAFGDAGMQALCEGLDGVPSLRVLQLGGNSKLGLASAEALAAALGRRALPQLEELLLNGIAIQEELHVDTPPGNSIGKEGAAALAAPLRKLTALKTLGLCFCNIGDEGVASLFADLGKEDFKAIQHFYLAGNKLTDKGCQTLVSALKVDAMPQLTQLRLEGNDHASYEAIKAVGDALDASWDESP